MSKYGQQFVCRIPNGVSKTANSEPFSNITSEEVKKVIMTLTQLDCLVLVCLHLLNLQFGRKVVGGRIKCVLARLYLNIMRKMVKK